MDQHKPLSYQPTDGLSYDPTEEKYWDEGALKKELFRAYEICHGCRMCFKFCDSFPDLFKLIDDSYDGNVTKITDEDTRNIMNSCFQCKLCEVQCPYTPRENHEFQLDFPKIVHRYNAQNMKKEGASFRDKLLGDPDGSAKMARSSFGLANTMNRVKVHRWFMEKIVGIHRDKQLPDFVGQTFEAWAEKNDKTNVENPEAVLFQTCYVQNNEPEIGKDTIKVMEKNQVKVTCEKGLECCGMPAWEFGDLETLRKRAKVNLDKLMPHVEAGAKVLVINPTCSMMFRREYPELLEGDDRARAEKLSAAVRDPGEYLWSIREEERFNTDFKSSPGAEVAYHAPCHLRTQSVGFKGRDLMRKIPGVKPKMVLECCGHDGTYAMKKESFEASKRIGKKAFDGMKDVETKVWSTECPLAAIQFEQHGGTKAMHPMSILSRAYEEDGFENRVDSNDKS